MRVTIYPDGFVRAFNSLCGTVVNDDFSNCDLRIDLVNCKKCRSRHKLKSKRNVKIETIFDSSNQLARKVYRSRAIYDIYINNLNRSKLNLGDYPISEADFEILVEKQDEIEDAYRKEKEEYKLIIEYVKKNGIQNYEIETTLSYDVLTGMSVKKHKIIVK